MKTNNIEAYALWTRYYSSVCIHILYTHTKKGVGSTDWVQQEEERIWITKEKTRSTKTSVIGGYNLMTTNVPTLGFGNTVKPPHNGQLGNRRKWPL